MFLPSDNRLLPQDIADLDPRYGVRACINIGSGYLDLIKKSTFVVHPSFSRAADKLGLRSSQNSGSYAVSIPSGVVNGEAVSFLVVAQAAAGQCRHGISSAVDGYGTPRIYCTNGVLEARATVAGNTNIAITGPTIAYDSDYVGIVRWRPGVGLAASFNGAAVQTSANSATTLYVSPDLLWYGASTATRAYLVAALGDVSDADMRYLSANPAAIFRSQPPVIWFGGGSSDLAGAASGGAIASGSGALWADIALAGVGVAVAGGAANAAAAVSLSATGFSVAGGAANGTATVQISASGLAEAAGSAGLSASVLLAGAGAAQASGNATLAAALTALADGAAQASGSGALVVNVQLAGAGAAVAGGSGTLSGGPVGAISGSGNADASGSGALTVSVAVSAAGFVQAMGAGALWVSVQLAASGGAIAGGTANLTLAGVAVLASDARYIARRPRRAYLSARARRSYEARY
ncbi:hypothetical protein [Accumulibacter sp.]|uniref:hypothetical protein n=1 Tax=Accumulibacter sp. TaxID=2053492 RepID=UPI0026016BC4|nr:hypothetical protein [Accumulibacter sp.]